MINQWLSDLDSKHDRMFEMQAKYMSLKELREFKDLANDCKSIKIKLGLTVLLAAAVLYSLTFVMCWMAGINFWYIAGIFMLFIGAGGTMLISAILYDLGKRSRETMDDRYIKAEELNETETMDE